MTGFVPSGGGPRKDGSTMSEFADQLDTRIDDVRHRIHEARSAGDDFLVENLVDDLQNLMELAGRNDVDTGPIAEVIQTHKGRSARQSRPRGALSLALGVQAAIDRLVHEEPSPPNR